MSTRIEEGDTVVFNGYAPVQDVRLFYPSRNPELQKGMFGIVIYASGTILRVSWDIPLRAGYRSGEHPNCWAVLASDVTKSKARPVVSKIIRKINDMYERQPYYKKVLPGESHV